MPNDAHTPKADRQMGLFAGISLLVGFALLGVTALSVLNTIFEWELSLSVYGADTPLPDNWETVIGLGAAAVLIIGFTYFGSTVARLFADAKGKPGIRIAIVASAVVLLAVIGRGIQVMALVSTYGSMLAYYCTDEGTLQDVQGQLEKDPTAEELDRCLGRTAQWGRADLLDAIVGAGGNFKDESSPAEYRSCVLSGQRVGLEYIQKAIALGATPATCADSESLIWSRVNRNDDDEETAAIVTALAKAGWSTSAMPEHQDKTPLELAQARQHSATASALQASY